MSRWFAAKGTQMTVCIEILVLKSEQQLTSAAVRHEIRHPPPSMDGGRGDFEPCWVSHVARFSATPYTKRAESAGYAYYLFALAFHLLAGHTAAPWFSYFSQEPLRYKYECEGPPLTQHFHRSYDAHIDDRLPSHRHSCTVSVLRAVWAGSSPHSTSEARRCR